MLWVLKTIDSHAGGWSLKQKVSVEQLDPTVQQQPNRNFNPQINPHNRRNGGDNAKRLTISARDKIMAASKNTEFYRRASLDRGETPASILFGPPPGVNIKCEPKVLTILTSINMKQYWPLFLSEAMDDYSMLVSLSQDKVAFRNALKEMGIARMGHREAILNAISGM